MSDPSREPADIATWQRIDGRLSTSGQPSEAQIADLARLGVRHVVNLGLHDHPQALPDERGTVETLGMRYHHVPVPFDAPEEAHYAAFAAILHAHAEETVHVHCIANYRVSAFLYRFRREQGVAESVARAAMERIWRPGGAWARLIGDADREGNRHDIAGMTY